MERAGGASGVAFGLMPAFFFFTPGEARPVKIWEKENQLCTDDERAERAKTSHLLFNIAPPLLGLRPGYGRRNTGPHGGGL